MFHLDLLMFIFMVLVVMILWMEHLKQLMKYLKQFAKHGTTSFTPTTMTMSIRRYIKIYDM